MQPPILAYLVVCVPGQPSLTTPDNLLVSSTMRVKVADFGTACLVGLTSASAPDRRPRRSVADRYGSRQSGRGQTTRVGTLLYMAPEMLALSAYDLKVDVYSFGSCRSGLTGGC